MKGSRRIKRAGLILGTTLLMLAAAAGSYFTTRESVHKANHFNFQPIQEVAILFIGIFATMIPALDWSLPAVSGLFATP